MEDEVTAEEAYLYLVIAAKIINTAKEAGRDIQHVEALLKDAEAAYNIGDHKLVRKLTQTSIILITRSKAAPVGKQIKVAEPTVEQLPSPYSWVTYLLGIIVIVVVLAGYLLLKGKKGYKGFKR